MNRNAKPFGIDDEAWTKLDRGLRREIERLDGNTATELLVMVSLRPGQVPAEGESVAQKEARFRDESRSLMQELEQHGAREIQGYWINSTVSARVPVGALGAIAKRSDVKQILLQVRYKAVP